MARKSLEQVLDGAAPEKITRFVLRIIFELTIAMRDPDRPKAEKEWDAFSRIVHTLAAFGSEPVDSRYPVDVLVNLLGETATRGGIERELGWAVVTAADGFLQ